MLIDFRQLFPKYGIKPKGVLHIGANIGEEAPVYDEMGINKVIWIEGNPDIYERLRSNVSRFPGQSAYNNCIGDVDGETVMHISNNSSQSSSILELGTHKVAHPEVHYIKDIPVKINRIETLFPADTLKDLDFLNIDLQGAELMALRGMGDILHQFKWAYLEINVQELYKGCALIGEIDAYMAEFKFERRETKLCGNTGWGDALYIRR